MDVNLLENESSWLLFSGHAYPAVEQYQWIFQE